MTLLYCFEGGPLWAWGASHCLVLPPLKNPGEGPVMWSSTMNFTHLSLKIKFLWSSENGRNFNIFDNASTFGLEFCNCLKDDNAVESILLFCIIMWLSTVNFTPLSLKLAFLWSAENGWKIQYFCTICTCLLFWT